MYRKIEERGCRDPGGGEMSFSFGAPGKENAPAAATGGAGGGFSFGAPAKAKYDATISCKSLADKFRRRK